MRPSSSLRASRAAGAFAMAVGCLVLLGWVFDIGVLKSIAAGFISMKANTAACFILLGAALRFSGEETPAPRSASALRACAWAVMALASLTLAQYLFGLDLRIDQLLILDPSPPASAAPPGRMTPLTATAFLLLGSALWASDRGHGEHQAGAQVLAAASGLMGLLAAIGYAYDAERLFTFGAWTNMAPHTALTFIVASLGVLAIRPDLGLTAVVASDRIGGFLARRLLIAALGLPFALIWLHLKGERLGLYGQNLGAAILSSILILLFTLFTLWTAASLNRLDEKRAEEERRSRAILSNTLEGFTIADSAGRFIEVNEAFCRMSGYPRRELLKMRITDIEAAESPGQTAEHIGRILREGRGRFETRHRRKDGTIMDVEIAVQTGAVGGERMAAFIRDITERKRAEEALLSSEEKYRTLYESSQDAIMTLFPPDWRFASGNPATVAMFGASCEADFTSRAPWEFSLERQPDGELSSEKAKRMIETAMEKGSNFFEWTHTRLDGRDFPATVLLTRYVIGGRAGLQATVRDISEQKRTEEELSRLSQALAQSPTLAIITDTKGDIEFVNPKFTEVTGYAPEEVLGRNPRMFKSGKTPPENYRKLWEALVSGKEWTGEFQNKRKDGSLFHARARIAPLRGPLGDITGFLALEEDITSQKELEDSLRQAQKIESLGRLAGGVAHDFNNLLTAINGFAQFLLEGFPPEDPRREDAREILAAGARAGALTQQLLAFSRKQVLNPRVLDLNSAVAGTLRMLKRLIGEDIRVETRLVPEPCLVKVDAGQIDQVLLNLAVNARDAMPKGGTLSIETRVLGFEEASPLVRASLRPGPVACLSVRDSGCGMSEEVRRHVFEPFFTTKEPGKGTGLGLAMVYGLVKQSGGEVEVESAPGRGAVFRISLPQVVDPAAAKGTAGERKMASPQGKETILLVEDEDLIRRLAERVLSENGYAILAASSGPEALEALRRHSKPVDLLITDVVMPNMNGRELAKELARRRLAPRTLFMSGYTDDAILRHGVLEPGLAFLYKPFTPAALSTKVREVLDGPKEEARA